MDYRVSWKVWRRECSVLVVVYIVVWWWTGTELGVCWGRFITSYRG